MNPIDLVFPSITLTKVEEDEISKLLSSSLLKKYLKSLAIEDSKELLSFGALDMTEREIADRHLFVSGKLAVLTTLLSI